MSTEPYPEVKDDDESGIGPHQNERPPEWPKKIRTLTASELDRLTIDGAGRFYWDGKLVNYEPPTAKVPEKLSDALARASSDLDRDPYSFDDEKPSRTDEADETEQHDNTQIQPVHAVAHREDRFHELEEFRPHRAMHHDGDVAEAYPAAIQMPDRVRVTMTRWQSLGAIIVVLCLIIGTLGVAAFGFIAAHDWGCRAGLIQSHCAAAPGGGRPLGRSDIPA